MGVQFQKKVFDGNLATDKEQTALVPSSFDGRLLQALTQRTRKEAMAMIPSLAKQMAKDSWQAELDIHRIHEAERVGYETLVSATQAIARCDAYVRQLIATHPQHDAGIEEEMLQELIGLVKQLPRVVVVAYVRRYHQV